MEYSLLKINYVRLFTSTSTNPYCGDKHLPLFLRNPESTRRSNQNIRLISNLMHKILVYLHIIHLLNSSTCFEHYPAHLQEVYVVIVYMQPLVSSLSAGDCLVHRLTKNQSFLNRCTRQSPAENDNTRGCIYIYIYIYLYTITTQTS